MSEYAITAHGNPAAAGASSYTGQVRIRWHTAQQHPHGKEETFLFLELSHAGGDCLWQGQVIIGTCETSATGERIVACPSIAAGASELMAQLGDYLDELGKTTRRLALTTLDGIVGIGARL